jgi:flagellar L-ring protein precursor FlgH
MKRFTLPIILCICTALLAGCTQTSVIRSPSFDEQLVEQRPNYQNGSIWQASSGSLTEDRKAKRKGDVLTILITETASASKQASTATSRESNISAGIKNLFGLEQSKTVSSWMASSQFDGSGSTSRKENLTATISAKVVNVIPNGNLQIEGRRSVKVNNEDQIILVEGTVRPRDITSDNVVNSSYIADARITYGGKGIISDRQSPGWLMNVFDKIWPF